MRQKYTFEMMLEEVMIAWTTGRCPRCGQALQVRAGSAELSFKCPGCIWEATGSPGFFQEVFVDG